MTDNERTLSSDDDILGHVAWSALTDYFLYATGRPEGSAPGWGTLLEIEQAACALVGATVLKYLPEHEAIGRDRMGITW